MVMLVMSALGAVLQLVGLISHIVGTGMGLAEGDGDELAHMLNGALGTAMNLVGLLASGFCIWGFLKMMRLESRTFSYAAVIISMVPCLGSCWCINLFIGIWALMVLSDPAVKAAHQN